MNINRRLVYTQYRIRTMTLQPPSLRHKPMRLKAKFTLTISNQLTYLLTLNHDATKGFSLKYINKFT